LEQPHHRAVRSKPHSVLCPILLVALIAITLLNNLIWLHIDSRPPRWDEAHHLTMSLRFHAALTSGGVATFARALVEVDPVRPPLVPALAVLAYTLFGKSPDTALAVNLLAFTVLILSVYGLGARLASPWSGLLAAFFASTSPPLVSMSRVFYVDFCHAALVATALYLLVRSHGFSLRRPSLAFGAVAGLGLLCRPFFPMFIIGPWGVIVYKAWRGSLVPSDTGGQRECRWWVNALLALMLSAAVAGPWYLVNMIPVVRRSLDTAYGMEAALYGPASPLSLHALLSFLINFTNAATMLGVALFLLGAIVLWIRRPAPISEERPGPANIDPGPSFVLSSVVVPLIIVSTARNQDLKHLLPVVPAMALTSAWGLSLLKPALLRNAVIGCGICVSLFAWWITSYGWSSLPWGTGVMVRRDLPKLLFFEQGSPTGYFTFALPRRENWRIPEVLERVVRGAEGPNGIHSMARPAVLAVIPDHPLFNAANFEYFALLQGLPVRVVRYGDPRDPEWAAYRTQLLGTDFAVVKTGDPGPERVNIHQAEMIQFLRSTTSCFVETSPQFALPDGSEAILYAMSRGPCASSPSGKVNLSGVNRGSHPPFSSDHALLHPHASPDTPATAPSGLQSPFGGPNSQGVTLRPNLVSVTHETSV
jgi:4-amino-4-deoxy-L-arabinose transferase-like glycosyltransferase